MNLRQTTSFIKSNPFAYAKWLNSAGIDWDTACIMAGYDEQKEKRKTRKMIVGFAAVVILVTVVSVALTTMIF